MARLQDIIGYGLHAARPAAGSTGALYYETDTQTLLRDNGTTWDTLRCFAYARIEDQKTANTNGGTFTSGAWQTRDLNTVVTDTGSNVTLASNQITLPAGTYRVQASAPGHDVRRHQIRLQNITDSATLALGTSEYSMPVTAQSDGAGTRSLLAARFTLSGSKALAVQHQCDVTKTTDGFGVACNFSTEVYTGVDIWKEA